MKCRSCGHAAHRGECGVLIEYINQVTGCRCVSANELTDRVAFCVVKANCPGPSFMRTHDVVTKRDRWECSKCGGHADYDPGELPIKDRRITGA